MSLRTYQLKCLPNTARSLTFNTGKIHQDWQIDMHFANTNSHQTVINKL